MNYDIRCTDCVEGMKRLDDGTIDLVITSPPYDNIRQYNGFSFDFDAVANQLYRVVKVGGVVVWIVGDATINGSETGTSFRQALMFMDIGFRLYDTMIYQKRNAIPKAGKRYNQSFEYMFVLSKGKPTAVNLLQEPCKNAGKICHGTYRENGDTLRKASGYGKPVKETKARANIWAYATGGGNTARDKLWSEHPAVMPLQLARDHVVSWSNAGDVVLDPMCGSGQTLIAAMLEGRNFIGMDCSEEYCSLTRERLEWYA